MQNNIINDNDRAIGPEQKVSVRLARDEREVEEAQRLRYRVFYD